MACIDVVISWDNTVNTGTVCEAIDFIELKNALNGLQTQLKAHSSKCACDNDCGCDYHCVCDNHCICNSQNTCSCNTVYVCSCNSVCTCNSQCSCVGYSGYCNDCGSNCYDCSFDGGGGN